MARRLDAAQAEGAWLAAGVAASVGVKVGVGLGWGVALAVAVGTANDEAAVVLHADRLIPMRSAAAPV